MVLRRELILAIGSLVTLNLLFAFGVIGLLVRMGPIIERILLDNVASMMAGEEMLAELAATGDAPMDDAARARMRRALERAKRNITEDEERPVIAAIEGAMAREDFVDAEGRRRLVQSIGELIEINRDAMIAVDEEARRQGLAGAWAAVLMGFLSFVFSLVVVAVIRRRWLIPVLELHDVIQRSAGGDRFRRCRALDAPAELQAVSHGVNALLDRIHAPVQPSEEEDAALTEEALALLLDLQPEGMVVVDRDGAIVHANSAARSALAGDAGAAVHDALARPREYTGADATPIRAVPSRSGEVFVCRLTSPSAGAA